MLNLQDPNNADDEADLKSKSPIKVGALVIGPQNGKQNNVLECSLAA